MCYTGKLIYHIVPLSEEKHPAKFPGYAAVRHRSKENQCVLATGYVRLFSRI